MINSVTKQKINDMKNKELIKILKGLDDELEIIVNDNCGGGYNLSKVKVVDMQDKTEKIELS